MPTGAARSGSKRAWLAIKGCRSTSVEISYRIGQPTHHAMEAEPNDRRAVPATRQVGDCFELLPGTETFVTDYAKKARNCAQEDIDRVIEAAGRRGAN